MTDTMTDTRAAEVLAAHNEWRRYNGETGVPGAPEMGDPTELGRAIDHVVSRLRAYRPVSGGDAPHCPSCECAEGVRVTPAEAQGGGEDFEAELIALVAGPYHYHHKMDEHAERAGKAFDRCRELTIQNIRTWCATRRAMLAAAPQPPAEAGASAEPWPRFILDEALEVLRNVDTQFRATGQPSARIERLINLLAGMKGRTTAQPPAEAHCATCSCAPGMTPAVRFDATPAERDGVVRDHLIRMGWTPPAEAQPDREPADWPHQDWKGMDGAIAWHLIDRHASGWQAVGEMMDAWLAANVPQPPAEAQAVAWRGEGKHGWTFTDSPHAHDIAVGIWEPLYTAPPSAPVGVDALRDARTIYDIACIRAEYANATREDVEFKAIALRNYNFLAQQPAAVDEAMAGWIADGDTIPARLIEATRNAIRLEFGNNGTDGYYKRILVRVFTALAAQQEGRSDAN